MTSSPDQPPGGFTRQRTWEHHDGIPRRRGQAHRPSHQGREHREPRPTRSRSAP